MADAAPQSPERVKLLRTVEDWDMETDVVVVGFGGSGACAAIEARAAGSEVIVLELTSGSGGSTAMSSGEMYLGGSGGTRIQKACGFEETTENFRDYLMASFGPNADEDKINFWAERATAHFDWVEAQGVPFKESHYSLRDVVCLTDDSLMYTGSEKAYPFNEISPPIPRGHKPSIEGDNGGKLLMETLTKRVEESGAEIHYDARVRTLIQCGNTKRVHGLVVKLDGKEINIKARKGVVLCMGGFVMNEEMVKKHCPEKGKYGDGIGNPGDQGHGILMGVAAGGHAINMHEGFISCVFYPPGDLTYGIFVNEQGQRFINEDVYHARLGGFALRQPGEKIYLFINNKHIAQSLYADAPIVATGDTVAEVEAEIGMAEGSLQNTVSLYNKFAANGEDPIFHKGSAWVEPLDGGPFALMDYSPENLYYPFFTLGGLDTLPTGEVLTPSRAPIEGLFAAGRTACGIPRTGTGYNSGMSVADVTFSGRMAGKAAANSEANS